MIISLLLGVIVGVVLDFEGTVQQHFPDPEDVENTLGLLVIALVPVAGSGGEELE